MRPTHQPSVEFAGVVLLTSDLAGQRKLFGDTFGLQTKWATDDAHVFSFPAGHDIGFFEPSHHPEAVERLSGASHGISHLEFRVGGGFDLSRLEAYRVDRQTYADADGNLFHL